MSAKYLQLEAIGGEIDFGLLSKAKLCDRIFLRQETVTVIGEIVHWVTKVINGCEGDYRKCGTGLIFTTT